MLFRVLAVLMLSGLAGFAQPPAAQEPSKRPTALREGIWVLPAGWQSRIPPSGAVNAPGSLGALTPGQRVALGLLAEGEARDALLTGCSLSVKLSGPSGTQVFQQLSTPGPRALKASGADFVLRTLKAGGVPPSEQARVEAATSLVSLATFELPWEAPEVAQETAFTVEVTLIGGAAQAPKFAPVSLKVRPWRAWWGDAAPTAQELDAFSKGFHAAPQPGRLLPMLLAASADQALEQHAVYGFFTAAFRAHAPARKAALAHAGDLSVEQRWALLLVLRLAGEDVTGPLGSLPPEAQSAVKEAQPLADPPVLASFQDPVSPESVQGLGIPMDLTWGAWMATGRPAYLQNLVGLLSGAEDFPALQAWMKAKTGAAGLNARVARGLAYQIAGWSLSAFEHSDPLVMDWLLYWQKDPSIPPAIRKELEGLASNPAFQRPR